MNKTIKPAIFALILMLTTNIAFAQIPTTGEEHYAFGRKQMIQKDFEGAIKSFSECLKLNAKAGLCEYARGISYFQTKKYDEAIGDFTSLLKTPSLDAAAKIQTLNGRIMALCYSSRVEEATKDENAVKALGGNIQKSCVQFLAENPGLKPTSSGTIEFFVKKGDTAIESKDYEAALVNYQKALNLYGANRKGTDSDLINSDFYVNLAIANRYNSNHDQAYIDLRKALELNPKNHKAFTKRGEYYVLDRSKNPANLKLAEADLTNAILIDPRNEEAYFERYFLYDELKNYQKAIADLKTLTELFPQNGTYLNFLAETYGRSGNYKEAVNAYTKIINDQPPSDNNKFTFTKRAEAFYKLGDYKSALTDLGKIENFYPKEESEVRDFTRQFTVEFYLLKGKSNLASNNLADALKDSSKALEFNLFDAYGFGVEEPFIKPLAIESYQLRTDIYCKVDKKQEAKADEQEIIKLGGKIEKPCK